MRNYLKRGDWNAVCDVCGFVHKANELRLRWDGLRVCSLDFEFRNPQDLIRIPKEDPTVPWTRPDPTISYTICTYITSQGLAGVGVAGCARAGVTNP